MQETILSTYAGHTIFSLFLDKKDVYEQIYKQFIDDTFIDEISSDSNDRATTSRRLLLGILEMPVMNTIIERSDHPDYNCDECIKYCK